MESRKGIRAPGGVRRGTGPRAGTTLIETSIAIAVVVVALGGFSRAVLASVVTSDQHAETSLALGAARRAIETLQASDFAEVYARFNSDATDDLADSLGAGFAVAGLQAVDGDADGLPGEIVFPTMEVDGGFELREDLVDGTLGMPRDLDGDGEVDAADHSEDYAILPVVVRVRWRGPAGTATVELRSLLADY